MVVGEERPGRQRRRVDIELAEAGQEIGQRDELAHLLVGAARRRVLLGEGRRRKSGDGHDDEHAQRRFHGLPPSHEVLGFRRARLAPEPPDRRGRGGRAPSQCCGRSACRRTGTRRSAPSRVRPGRPGAETPRTVQPRLHGRRGNAERLGRLFDAHLLHVAHHEDDAEGLRQGVDGALEQAGDFPPRGGALRIGIAAEPGNGMSCASWPPAHRRPPAQPRTAPAQAAKRLVQRNPRQPGGEARFARENPSAWRKRGDRSPAPRPPPRHRSAARRGRPDRAGRCCAP